tara:strand:- start:1327 stop:1497 length:171 start_codon:yes stop_codon:yes gene_type:complete
MQALSDTVITIQTKHVVLSKAGTTARTPSLEQPGTWLVPPSGGKADARQQIPGIKV